MTEDEAAELAQKSPNMLEDSAETGMEPPAHLEDALLVGADPSGTPQYIADAATSPGGKRRVHILASLSGKMNRMRRGYDPEFVEGSLPQANKFINTLPCYGESPHPAFNEKSGNYDTSPAREIWRMVRWFTDAAKNLWATVEIDPTTAAGARLLTKIDRTEKIGVSVRWDSMEAYHAKKQPSRRQLADGTTYQYFDKSMVGYIFPAFLDHVPNPAFMEAGNVMLDSATMIPMTDATILLTDLPDVPAAPCPPSDSSAGGGSLRSLGHKTSTHKENLRMNPKEVIASLRERAAAATDESVRTSLMDAATLMETNLTDQSVVNLADSQRAALDQLTSGGLDLAELANFVKNDKATKDAAAAKAKVVELADAVKSGSPVEGFDLSRFAHEEQRVILANAVRQAATEDDAKANLRNAVAMNDSAVAAAKLAVQGLNLAPAGATQVDPAARVEVIVDEGDKDIAQVCDSLNAAFDQAAEDNGHRTDPAIRKANQPYVDRLIADNFGDGEKKSGKPRISHKSLADSARFLLADKDARSRLNMSDSMRNMVDSGMYIPVSDASVNMGTVLNAPTVAKVILQRRYQDMNSGVFMQGMVSDAFENFGALGTVLRIMTELYTPPSHDMLGVVLGSQIVGEDQPIPEGSLATAWQNIPIQRRRLGISVTEDIERAMLNGPLNYNVTARSLYHVIYNAQRDADNRFYTESNTASDEIGAVAVTAETVASGNWSYSAGGSAVQDGIAYGANVVGVAQINPAYTTKNYDGSTTVRLTDSGWTPSTATAYRAPIVQSRVTTSLNGDTGVITNSVKNPITVTGGGTTQVQGYLEPKTGMILGANATFAVDFARGKFVFAASSGFTGTTLPTLAAYSYSTNAKYIQVKYGSAGFPNGLTPEAFYNRILQAADRLVAGMAEYPNFAPPNIALSSFTGATPITEASVFYHLNSPTGTVLGGSMEMNYASRKGVDYCQVNAPTVIGDDTILYFQKGVVKHGVDLPLSMKGPFQTQDVTGGTGLMRDSQRWFAHEFFAMAAIHARDGNGNILNGKLSKLIMY